MLEQEQILVVGGGIGGMAAALSLARQNHKVRLLERAPEFGEIGYGLQLGPNAYRALEHLGVAQVLHDKAFFPKSIVMLDALDGRELTRMDLGDPFLKRYGRPYSVIHRSDLHGILLQACRADERIQLHTGKGIAAVSQDANGVGVECEDGSVYHGSALIGADGLRSVVRKRLIDDGNPRVAGQAAFRGVVPVDSIEDRTHMDSVVLWVGHNMHMVQYRLRGGAVMNTVAVIESDELRLGQRDALGPQDLDQTFAQAIEPVRRMLDFVDKSRNWVLSDRDPQPAWHQGRIALLGDAAHPTLQYLAQGACMALEDAVVLGELASAQSNAPLHQQFEAYTQARYLRTARVQLTSRFFCGVCHAGGGARDLRNGLLRTRPHDQYLEVDWLYKEARS